MFKQVTIIGFGLLGSSIARALRHHGQAETIICADASRSVCETVQTMGLADKVTADIGQSVKGSDLVILAVPVGAMEQVASKIAPHLQKDAIITDTGSVKMDVIRQVQDKLPASVHFIPSHPVAGTENSGPEAGFHELFEGRWWILTPLAHSDVRAVEKLTKLYESFGSNIEIMEAGHHDMVLGLTSHLPTLIAFTIVGTATELEDDVKSEVIKFSASGFRDFTRLAAQDPTMWRDVMLSNKEAVLELLQRFTEDLNAMQKAIRKQDGDYLYGLFGQARAIRKEVIEAGQAEFVYPNKSRGTGQ